MCCACGGGTTDGSNDDSADDTPTTGCVDDETTPQECLDQWVEDFTFTTRSCFINSQTLTYTLNGNPSHAYILYYGGCGSRSVDVWFNFSNNDWNDLLISSSANALDLDGRRKEWNLKTGGADRVGFRVPADQINGFRYQGRAVGN